MLLPPQRLPMYFFVAAAGLAPPDPPLFFGAFGPAALPLGAAFAAAGFFVDCRAFASFAASSFACCRNSGFWAFFFLISSSDMPTIAFWNFATVRVRFLVVSSVLPFLFIRRQACVQRSFTGLILCLNSEAALALMKKETLPSFAMNFLPWP